MADLRTARQLAAEIPERGATLYDLLTKEVDLKVRAQCRTMHTVCVSAGTTHGRARTTNGVG
jgi:hypothetical protein